MILKLDQLVLSFFVNIKFKLSQKKISEKGRKELEAKFYQIMKYYKANVIKLHEWVRRENPELESNADANLVYDKGDISKQTHYSKNSNNETDHENYNTFFL